MKTLFFFFFLFPIFIQVQTTLDEIITDMTLAYEGRPHGVPTTFDWGLKPRIGAMEPPAGWNAAIAWGQLYEWAGGNPATNARVQIKDLKMYYLSKADPKWHLLQKSVGVGGNAYVEDFAGDVNKPVDKRIELHPLFQQQELVRFFIANNIVSSGSMALGSPNRPGHDRFAEHQADMQHSVIQQIAKETGTTPPEVCLAWAHQRENSKVGYVAMAERSEWINSNLLAATKNILSQKQFEAIDGNGTPENPGIHTNNRLIWGQVFFWPETRLFGHDRDALWNDIQNFETILDYEKFSKAAAEFYKVLKATAVDLTV